MTDQERASFETGAPAVSIDRAFVATQGGPTSHKCAPTAIDARRGASTAAAVDVRSRPTDEKGEVDDGEARLQETTAGFADQEDASPDSRSSFRYQEAEVETVKAPVTSQRASAWAMGPEDTFIEPSRGLASGSGERGTILRVRGPVLSRGEESSKRASAGARGPSLVAMHQDDRHRACHDGSPHGVGML